ncbi:MAG TPA: CoA pyrophosphatase [Burkholderiaceae bacterium]|nr:CoA pyrophosphatase [Burkholderiaceae bacterium]
MPLSFDPQKLPVIGIDDHLPALTPAVLHGDALRQRFLTPPVWTPEIKTEGRFTERAPAHASVLIALVPRNEITVLLTQRTDHLTDHPGQISFPGGRVDAGDADAAATALREAHEEIGLETPFVDVLGALPTYTTGTGFIVTPVVALVRPGFTVQAEPFEVAEVFEVPLSFLMNPANHRRHAVEVNGTSRQFLSIPWDGLDEAGQPRRYFIWGATAAMLRNLYRFLAA